MNERIRELIKALNMKQAEFAKRIGVSRPFVSELCSGNKKPSDRTVADICREFNVNEQWLRTGEGDMFLSLSREEEITKHCMSIAKQPPSEFTLKFIHILSQLEPAQWQLLSDMADKLLAQRDAQKKDAE